MSISSTAAAIHQQNRTTIPTLDQTSNAQIAMIGGGIFLAIIISVLCAVVIFQYFRIKMLKMQSERSKYMSSIPYNTGSSHPYLEERIYDEVIDSSNSYEVNGYLGPNPSIRISERRAQSETYAESTLRGNEGENRAESEAFLEIESARSVREGRTGTAPYAEPSRREGMGEGSSSTVSYVEPNPCERVNRGDSSHESDANEVHNITELIHDTASRQDKVNKHSGENIIEEYDDAISYIDLR